MEVLVEKKRVELLKVNIIMAVDIKDDMFKRKTCLASGGEFVFEII